MPRCELYERINKRVDIMIKEGLIEEVKKIISKYKEFPTAMQGLGYKEVLEFLENKITKEEMIEKIKMEQEDMQKGNLHGLNHIKKQHGLIVIIPIMLIYIGGYK